MTQFNVRPRDDGQHGRTIEEESFEAAALAYVEVWLLPVTDADMSVVVRDLESGDTQACG